MSNVTPTLFPLAAPMAVDPNQFRLTKIQVFNWGTFSKLLTLPIPEVGYLLVGPSGSGKSTLLDAHAQLITPPRWVDFNVAARENDRNTKDRNILTYVRGAYAKNTQDDRQVLTQYLRTGSTYSAIAETYTNGCGKIVVLAQLFWVKGASNSSQDVKKLFFVFERSFELREFEPFAAYEFDVRKLKAQLEGDFVREDFNSYQERFRRRLGIESERALRLLHKTQSAKNLGDLNTFLRDFMLDPPETFALAYKLVAQFGELNEAYQAVVTAGKQIEILTVAEQASTRAQAAQDSRRLLREVFAGIEPYKEQRHRDLLLGQIESTKVLAEFAAQEESQLKEIVRNDESALRDLLDQRAGAGGQAIERLEAEIKETQDSVPTREAKRKRATEACRKLGWTLPDNAMGFGELVVKAKERLFEAEGAEAKWHERRDKVVLQLSAKESELTKLLQEIRAMEQNRSNIPAYLQDLRDNMARELDISANKLPFAGELLDVKRDAVEWQGALERLMRPLATSLLVDERYYAQVSQYLNDRYIGGRLSYLRMVPHPPNTRALTPGSSFRKLSFAESPYQDWLREEIKALFDFECVSTMQEFREKDRALTKTGQIKRSKSRHEKDDSYQVDDRSRWVMGSDNKAKRELFGQKVQDLNTGVTQLNLAKGDLASENQKRREDISNCQLLSHQMWQDIDVASLLTNITKLEGRLKSEKMARPELAELDDKIKGQAGVVDVARENLSDKSSSRKAHEKAILDAQRELQDLYAERLLVRLTPVQQDGLRDRVDDLRINLTVRNISEVMRKVSTKLNDEIKTLELTIQSESALMEKQFVEFNRLWPADSNGLDPVVASSTDYFAKLIKLETDGLPKYQERFFTLLREQSGQSLVALKHQMETEKLDIYSRLKQVNDSLRDVPFNRGTRLSIELRDKIGEEVRDFQRLTLEILSRTVNDDDRSAAEQRFLSLRALVDRLKSQETVDRNWRELVLDVRQHVEFVAREFNEDNEEVEAYTSGDGKSGGQRQKLTATCLAAALCYQLGGRARRHPQFSTVVLDEAFDKADSEFTTIAMTIFKNFGFQMVVATPLKSVMTLEPFIGGACFVQNLDRKSSKVLTLEYDHDAHRLLGLNQLHVEEATAS